MTKIPQTMNIQEICDLFARSVQQSMHDLLNVENALVAQKPQRVEEFESSNDLYFTLLFTGQIYGEFIISLKKQTAIDMLCRKSGNTIVDYSAVRDEIIDSFKEVINIASGKAITALKKHYPDLTITPPKAIEGYLNISGYTFEELQLVHASGVISCYMYVDYMRLDIIKTLEKSKNLLSEEHRKQEELKRLNKAKSEFLANMSHELRTPLNGMIGMLDVLKTSELSEVQKEQFDLIYNSGEFLLSLISEILEFSKIESGKLEIEKKSFNLRNAIDTVAESLAVAVYKKNLDFNIWVSPEISGNYWGDETRIKQVLINLIGNAIKFTPTGSISVIAKLDGDAILIHVIDTGIGIPVSKINKIFESFSQADVSDTRRYGGTGLGLTISRTIVQAMGGTLDVTSVEAEGSNFRIRVPLEKDGHRVPLPRVPVSGLDRILCWTTNDALDVALDNYVQDLAPGVTFESAGESFSGGLTRRDAIFIDVAHMSNFSKDRWQEIFFEARQEESEVVFLLRANELQKMEPLIKEYGVERAQFIKLPITEGLILNYFRKRIEAAFGKSPSQTPTVASVDPTRLKILVAEDNKINQVVISTMLGKLGYTSEVVENGREVLELLQSGAKYDVILMDCQMPVMDGYEATKEIRKLDSLNGHHTHIIALTANAFKETKELCFESGMDDFATKPIKLDLLKDTLLRVANS